MLSALIVFVCLLLLAVAPGVDADDQVITSSHEIYGSSLFFWSVYGLVTAVVVFVWTVPLLICFVSLCCIAPQWDKTSSYATGASSKKKNTGASSTSLHTDVTQETSTTPLLSSD